MKYKVLRKALSTYAQGAMFEADVQPGEIVDAFTDGTDRVYVVVRKN